MSEDLLGPDAPVLERLDSLVKSAKRAGAMDAEAVIIQSVRTASRSRLGKQTEAALSEENLVGLRVFLSKGRQAGLAASGGKPEDEPKLISQALAMAAAAPEDPAGALPQPARETLPQGLDLLSPPNPPSALADMALAAENAALSMPGITNSEGAEAACQHSRYARADSHGFAAALTASRHDVFCAVLAAADSQMERDYDYASARHASDLPPPEEIGQNAGKRAAARLRPRKITSRRAPILFHHRAARSLLAHFAAAASGEAVARQASFLTTDSLGKKLFAPAINIIDDPLRPRGLRSRPFDSEGALGKKRPFVQNGELSSFFLDSPSARRLSMTSTAHAQASPGQRPAPSPSNLFLCPGNRSPRDIIASLPHALYVTELIGQGVNILTGDYSRGAAGFWIENGQCTHPVSEVTIAGNLKDMFLHMEPADNLLQRFGLDAPSILVESMTIAGA